MKKNKSIIMTKLDNKNMYKTSEYLNFNEPI